MSYTFSYGRQMSFAPKERITWGVQRLILLNIGVFAGQLLLDIPLGSVPGREVPGGELAGWLAFQPLHFLRGFLWLPFTYMFLHANLMHIFFNMLWLFFFGPDVERGLGTRQFLWFYVLCGALGVLATLVPLALQSGVLVSVTGASGAVMGVTVAYAFLNPEKKFMLFPLPIEITAWALVVIVLVMNVISAVQGGGNTSVATHLGGMAVGFAYMKVIPIVRQWLRASQKPRDARPADKKPGADPLGEEIDNILKFDDWKKKR